MSSSYNHLTIVRCLLIIGKVSSNLPTLLAALTLNPLSLAYDLKLSSFTAISNFDATLYILSLVLSEGSILIAKLPILTFFFRYMKELIEAGYIYIATPPLYLVKKGQKKSYAWNDDQRDRLMQDFGSGSSVQRYKGLGEMNAGQLWDTTMNPEERTLRKVTIDNGGEADRIFSMLMGDEVPPRREFIEKNAIYANIDV